jgi:hypothetical protein
MPGDESCHVFFFFSKTTSHHVLVSYTRHNKGICANKIKSSNKNKTSIASYQTQASSENDISKLPCFGSLVFRVRRRQRKYRSTSCRVFRFSSCNEQQFFLHRRHQAFGSSQNASPSEGLGKIAPSYSLLCSTGVSYTSWYPSSVLVVSS